MRLLILLALAFSPVLLGAASSELQEEYGLAWKIDEASIIEYSLFDISGKRKPINPGIVVFGREIATGIVPTDSLDVPLAMLFVYPPRKVRLREAWEVDLQYLKSVSPMSPVRVVGRCSFTKIVNSGGTDCAQLEGQYQIFFGGTKKQEGNLETAQWIAISGGKLVAGRYRYSGKTEEWDEREIRQGSKKDSIEIEWKDTHNLSGAVPRERVDSVAKRGANFLLSKQTTSGSFGNAGVTGLVLAALLHSGVKRDSPGIQKAFQWLRSQKVLETYDSACILLAIEAAYLPLETMEDVLRFDERDAVTTLRSRISKEDRDFAKRLAQTLVQAQAKSGGWGYTASRATGDQSNTQYAAMGLKAASRIGAEVPTDVWRRLADYLIRIQCPQGDPTPVRLHSFKEDKLTEFTTTPGGWTYSPPDNTSDPGMPVRSTLTTGCAAALRLCESELAGESDEFRGRLKKAQQSALAWISSRYSVRKSVAAPESYHFYYLYALERVGILFDIKSYDKRDWYAEGAMYLLGRQREDGSWESGLGTMVDTSFALLFLKKAVVPVATQSGK